jgi:hypothetical protein
MFFIRQLRKKHLLFLLHLFVVFFQIKILYTGGRRTASPEANIETRLWLKANNLTLKCDIQCRICSTYIESGTFKT